MALALSEAIDLTSFLNYAVKVREGQRGGGGEAGRAGQGEGRGEGGGEGREGKEGRKGERGREERGEWVRGGQNSHPVFANW